jgi:hypothetical protein
MFCSRKKNFTTGQRVDLISNMVTGPGKLEFKVFEDSEVINFGKGVGRYI